MKKKNRYKMKVIASGFAENFRYRVWDADRGYWSGTEWVKEPIKSMLYYRHEDAVQAMKEIQDKENKDKPVRRLQAAVTVELIGPNSLDKQELANYLSKEARLTLDHAGPDKDTLVYLQIDWGTLTETLGDDS